MDPEKIGKFICQLRKEKNLSQYQLADMIPISRQGVSKWERGVTTPDPQTLLQLSEMFDVSINELLKGERLQTNTIEDLEQTTLSILDQSNKKTKMIKRITAISIIIITVLLLAFLSYYFINSYNSTKVYTIYGEGQDFKTYDGLMIVTNEKMYIKLGRLTNNKNHEISSLKMYYKNNDRKKLMVQDEEIDNLVIRENIGYSEKLQEKYLKHFYLACEKMGLILTPFENLKWDKNKDWATIIIYNEIKSHPENKQKCPDLMWESLDSFRYNYLYNNETAFYIDKTEDYPSLEECIEIIHKAKGKAFLAHIFIYDWAKNKVDLVNDIVQNYNLDGIECFYTKFSNEQTQYISSLCDEKNLFQSGGSDYHGLNKPGINLGKGYGNLQIPDYIISDWNNRKNYFKTFIRKNRLLLTDGINVNS